MRVFGHWELFPSAPSIPYQDPTLPHGTIVRRLCLSILEATDLIVINQGSHDPHRGWILCQKGTICTNLPPSGARPIRLLGPRRQQIRRSEERRVGKECRSRCRPY